MKTFKIGGVHPPEEKISAGESIKVLPIPEQVIIPLGQHIGAPATPIVEKGSVVKAGQLIATATGFVSANVHSSVSGTVVAIGDFTDAAGLTKPGITIKVEGDEWADGIDSSKEIARKDFSKEEIIAAIKEAGIVGMGGATFPTHVKLSPPPGAVPEILVINGVECEPYLTADHRVMVERTEEIIIGIELLMKAIGVTKAVVGIENNKPDAIQRMKEFAAKSQGIEICPLKLKYPQGGEKQLIQATTGRCVPPPPAIPISVGAVVQNVGTALAVYEAVEKHKPLVERVVTVTGKSLAHPSNFLVRIGTPVSALIAAAGGMPEDTMKVIGGGPMMGRAMANVESPVMKGTSGVLIMNDKEALRKPERNCIRCAKCVSVCPMGLEPYLLAKYAKFNMLAEMESERITDCIECGSCSFTCPSNRTLLDYIRLGKGRVMAAIRARSAKK